MGTPNNGVGEIKFGREPRSGAVWTGLLGVRRTDRNVRGGERVAKGGSNDVGGPEVGARDEARNLHLSSVIPALSSSVNEGSDRIVATSGVAQGAADGASPGSQSGRWRRVTTSVGEPNQRTPQAPVRRGGN